MTNIRPGSVVVGVDASAPSDAAVAWAVDQAALGNRPLVLVHATGAPDVADLLGARTEARQERRMRGRRVTDHALELVRRLSPDADVTCLTPAGDAREVLPRLSEQASIVVLGTRGHGPVASLLLGSVSVTVATHAHCSVAVVRPREEPSGHVVVGVSADGSDDAALLLAAEIASAKGVGLRAIHGWQTSDMYVDPVSHHQRLETMDRHGAAMERALAVVVHKFPDLVIDRHMPDAGPVAALVKGSRGADCVVVGSRGRSSTLALIGSVSRAVVEEAHSTVVVARSQSERTSAGSGTGAPVDRHT